MVKRSMSDRVYRPDKSYGHNPIMVDACGRTVHEGDEVVLFHYGINKSRYIVDEIDSHIAYLRPIVDTGVPPFPVLSDQIMRVERLHTRA